MKLEKENARLEYNYHSKESLFSECLMLGCSVSLFKIASAEESVAAARTSPFEYFALHNWKIPLVGASSRWSREGV